MSKLYWIKVKVAMFLFNITPRIHNLSNCWYIQWLDHEWIIPKNY